jgi:hypothetical protein
MALAAGTKLGPYEILAPLGAGGMGECTALVTRALFAMLPSKSLLSGSVNASTGNPRDSGLEP